MCHRHNFYRISDMLTARERVEHTFMIHGYPITHTDCRKLDGRAASHAYTGFYRFSNAVQMHMSRYDLILCIYNADYRAFYLFIRKSQSIKESSVRNAFHAFFHKITYN